MKKTCNNLFSRLISADTELRIGTGVQEVKELLALKPSLLKVLYRSQPQRPNVLLFQYGVRGPVWLMRARGGGASVGRECGERGEEGGVLSVVVEGARWGLAGGD